MNVPPVPEGLVPLQDLKKSSKDGFGVSLSVFSQFVQQGGLTCFRDDVDRSSPLVRAQKFKHVVVSDLFEHFNLYFGEVLYHRAVDVYMFDAYLLLVANFPALIGDATGALP